MNRIYFCTDLNLRK